MTQGKVRAAAYVVLKIKFQLLFMVALPQARVDGLADVRAGCHLGVEVSYEKHGFWRCVPVQSVQSTVCSGT